MEILLNSILRIKDEEFKDWTLCLNNAPNTSKDEELYSFLQNPTRMLEHISWRKHPNSKVCFRKISTKYCLQFLRLDKDNKFDNWLFLGAFENKGINKFPDGHEVHDLVRIDRFNEFSEKLIVKFKKKQGAKQAKIAIENINSIQVIKVLEEIYIKSNHPFPGFDNVSLKFSELKRIIEQNIDNWRELLSNVNCVYVITDTSTGKLYIGSTYGYNGIWQRWSAYVNTNGHGNDVKLKNLIKSDPNYAIKNFKFTILESFFNMPFKSDYVLKREKYWKKVLCTKEFGNNDN